MYFYFKINEQNYKIKILEVKEVLPIPQKITSIPLSEPKCLGMFQIRDSIYTLQGKNLNNYAKDAVVMIGVKGQGVIVDNFSLKGDDKIQEIDFLKALELV